MYKYYKNKTILVTGGTGTFGKNYIKFLLKNTEFKKLIIYSRDELKQVELSQSLNKFDTSRLRFFIGDVRDLDRLIMACREVDIVIHAAALKHVPVAEYNPFECIKTNIVGSQNVIEASLRTNVKNVIALSTDKACSPVNLYGATKLCSEKIFVSANQLSGKRKTKFSVVRYGNVAASRGSVIPLFLKFKDKNYFPITDMNMTRFNISIQEAFELVTWALNNNKGGEIFIPKLSSFKIVDLAKAINNKAKLKVIGIREGEKVHEELISQTEYLNSVDLGKYFALIVGPVKKKYKNIKPLNQKQLKENNSGLTDKKLNINQIKKILKNIRYIDI